MRTFLSDKEGINVFVDGSAPSKAEPQRMQTGLYVSGLISYGDYITRDHPSATSIMGELHAVCDGLEFIESNILPAFGPEIDIRLYTDNSYVHGVCHWKWYAKDHNEELGEKIMAILRNNKGRIAVILIPREFNAHADTLSKLGRQYAKSS